MKAVIVEDEAQAVMALKQKKNQSNCPQLVLCGNASNVEDADTLIMKERPDLIFLDIQLKRETDSTSYPNWTITASSYFTTAYSQYALQAIKISALITKLKPVDSEELVKAVAKRHE